MEMFLSIHNESLEVLYLLLGIITGFVIPFFCIFVLPFIVFFLVKECIEDYNENKSRAERWRKDYYSCESDLRRSRDEVRVLEAQIKKLQEPKPRRKYRKRRK